MAIADLAPTYRYLIKRSKTSSLRLFLWTLLFDILRTTPLTTKKPLFKRKNFWNPYPSLSPQEDSSDRYDLLVPFQCMSGCGNV